MPGERGLLAVAEWPEADPSRFDEPAEAELGRLIEAVTALRRYRDEVNAKPGRPVRGRLAAEGYDALRDQIARLARFAWVDASQNGDVLATVPIPAAGCRCCPPRPSTPRRRCGGSTRSARQLRSEIERAERKLANEGFGGQGSARGGGRGAPQARRVPRRVAPPGGLVVTFRQAEEYLLGLELFRHALRARSHAPVDDGAGPAATPFRLDSRRGLQRQVVDRALHRRDPAAPRPALGQLHLAAPGLVRERIEVGEGRPSRRPTSRRR